LGCGQSGREILQALGEMQGRRQAGFAGGFVDVGDSGRHKACPYWAGWGEYCWLDMLLGKNEHGG